MKSFLLIAAIFLFNATYAQKTVFYPSLSEVIETSNLCQLKADTLFDIIRSSKSFNWNDENNNCEDRANAVSLILDSWHIPNGKAWIFQGITFDKNKFKGTLGGYTYHVACCILIKNDGNVDTLVIDPLMNKDKLLSIREWTDLIATTFTNVYIVTSNKYYQQSEVSPTPNWKIRDKYFDDTIDGLTRYNNYSFWTRLKTKKYLKNRTSILNEFNGLTFEIPEKLKKINCN